jgi:predicted CXXCH cytochrome family protein
MDKRYWILSILISVILALYAVNNTHGYTDLSSTCYECHKELRKELSSAYVHKPVQEGNCMGCHNPHAGRSRALLNQDISMVCIPCHKEIGSGLTLIRVHDPVKKRLCVKCHEPHAGDISALLREKESVVCAECHKEVVEKVFEFSCREFTEGNCSSCHDSHASSLNNLLNLPPERLCSKCHEPTCTMGGTSIVEFVKGLDCTMCHSGHGSDRSGALGPYGHKAFLSGECEKCHLPAKEGRIRVKKQGSALCLECHGIEDGKMIFISDNVHVRDKKNPCVICHSYHASQAKNLTLNESEICMNCHEKTEQSTRIMESLIRTPGCAPVKNRRCFECHIPSHSTDELDLRGGFIITCARCHETEHKISHPVGEDVIDPRNNRPMTCISCHSMHASRADFMLTHDRNRALCIQCHRM